MSGATCPGTERTNVSLLENCFFFGNIGTGQRFPNFLIKNIGFFCTVLLFWPKTLKNIRKTYVFDRF